MSKSKSPSLKPAQRAPESGQYGIVGTRGCKRGRAHSRAYATPHPHQHAIVVHQTTGVRLQQAFR